MIRFFLKEASLLFAFIVLGALLLLCLWITNNVRRSILREFQNAQVSVVLHDGAETKVRDIIEKDPRVIRYDFYSSLKNKNRLGDLYPELKNVIAPLEDRFFPSSVVVTVTEAESFLLELKKYPQFVQSQILHQPPVALRQFLDILTSVFLGLWLLTLSLVLYFNLERITQKEEPRWSLMKMLGARPYTLFAPLWYGQALRITIASVSAIALALLVSHQVKNLFIWNWVSLPSSIWFGFFFLSLLLTSGISFFLFFSKYKKVSIG